jgi:excisionase family DNA binding protein
MTKREPEKRVVYSVGEVARMIGRDRTTIWRWMERGVLRAVPIPGGKRMVDATSLDKLLKGEAPRPKRVGGAVGG